MNTVPPSRPVEQVLVNAVTGRLLFGSQIFRISTFEIGGESEEATPGGGLFFAPLYAIPGSSCEPQPAHLYSASNTYNWFLADGGEDRHDRGSGSCGIKKRRVMRGGRPGRRWASR